MNIENSPYTQNPYLSSVIIAVFFWILFGYIFLERIPTTFLGWLDLIAAISLIVILSIVFFWKTHKEVTEHMALVNGAVQNG